MSGPRRGPATPRARAEANARASGLVEAVRVTLVQSGTALLWRNNVGQARYGAAVVRYGLGVGSPDLVGILRHEGGRALGVECKDAGGELEYEQACWLRAWTAAGGLGIVARSVEDACAVMVPGPARDAVVERTREEIEAAIARRERRRA